MIASLPRRGLSQAGKSRRYINVKRGIELTKTRPLMQVSNPASATIFKKRTGIKEGELTMSGVRDLAVSRGASTLIFDPHIIIEDPLYNTRDMNSESTQSHIREMADAIKANGNEMFPPITITQYGDKVMVISGWCRRRAHILAMEEGAPVKGILCLNVGKKAPEEITLQILASNDGLPLTVPEKAEAIRRLQSFMWSYDDIAKKIGWSVSKVRNVLILHDAPDDIVKMVKDGEISPSAAIRAIQAHGADGAKEVIETAIDTAKKEGRKKPAIGDLAKQDAKKIPWSTYGPKMHAFLKGIYETPANDRQRLMEKISNAGELLAEIEDKYPEYVETCGY